MNSFASLLPANFGGQLVDQAASFLRDNGGQIFMVFAFFVGISLIAAIIDTAKEGRL